VLKARPEQLHLPSNRLGTKRLAKCGTHELRNLVHVAFAHAQASYLMNPYPDTALRLFGQLNRAGEHVAGMGETHPFFGVGPLG
jgi:hypothetical protein